MTLYQLDEFKPELSDPERVWIAPDSHVIGRVNIGLDVSIWFGRLSGVTMTKS